MNEPSRGQGLLYRRRHGNLQGLVERTTAQRVEEQVQAGGAQRDNQVLFGGKIAKERTGRHVDSSRDVVDGRCGVTPLGEQFTSRFGQLSPGAFLLASGQATARQFHRRRDRRRPSYHQRPLVA